MQFIKATQELASEKPIISKRSNVRKEIKGAQALCAQSMAQRLIPKMEHCWFRSDVLHISTSFDLALVHGDEFGRLGTASTRMR